MFWLLASVDTSYFDDLCSHPRPKKEEDFRILSTMKRPHLPANERHRSDPTDPIDVYKTSCEAPVSMVALHRGTMAGELDFFPVTQVIALPAPGARRV